MKIIIKIKTNNNECAHIYINVNEKRVRSQIELIQERKNESEIYFVYLFD